MNNNEFALSVVVIALKTEIKLIINDLLNKLLLYGQLKNGLFIFIVLMRRL